MSKKWIFVTTPENLRICLKYNVFGVDERYEITATEHISPGDYIFFYTTRKMEFIGPFRIKQAGKYMENHPAIKEWKPKDKYKIIIQLDRPQEITTTNLETVFNKLLFITNRGRGPGGRSDHFQSSIISIREEDYKTILNAGKKTTPLT